MFAELVSVQSFCKRVLHSYGSLLEKGDEVDFELSPTLLEVSYVFKRSSIKTRFVSLESQ